MTDSMARQLHAIFMQALELDTSSREDFVRRACAGDAALEGQVVRLLATLDRSKSFLEKPALGVRTSEAVRIAAIEPARIQVPGYRPIRVIGVGGMATVYEAVQDQPERAVALKVMNRGLDSASAVRRFKYESEVLGRLHHPAIARIFEAGTCDDGSGRAIPFFAMELIPRASTITEYAREQHLTVREKIELFVGVCDAVQHGHQLGVIHRDLKPGNILVDESGQGKVIDFGIARPMDPGAENMTERADVSQLIGTLNYMSPEQCASSSAIDARTDVYSLGVVLFQLLVGRLPYDLTKSPLAEAIRTIAEREAPHVRSFQPEIPADLDAIIAKAINKDRNDRYTGVDSFAADMRRFLKGLPVEARQPGALELLAKWARRNRPLAATIAMLTLSLVAGTVFSTRYAYQAARARDVAVQRGEELEAITSLQESLLRGLDAASMGDHLRAVIVEKVKSTSSDPEFAEQEFTRLAAGVNFTSVAIQSLHDSVLLRQKISIDERFADQPQLRGRLLQQLADTMNSLGLHAEVEPILRDALAARLTSLGDDHEDTLQTMHSLGAVISTLGRQDEAIALLNEVSERCARTLGEDHEMTLRIATSLGGAYRRKGDHTAAERIWRRSLELQRRTLGDDASATLRTLNNMGVVLAAQGKWAEAEQCWTELLDRRRRLVGEDHADYLSALGNLGVLLQDRGDLARARPMMEQALASDRRRFGDRHVNTLTSMAQLASLLEDMRAYEEAEKLQFECWQGRRETLGDTSAATLRAKAFLASIMHMRGERTESGRLMQEAHDLQQQLLGDEEPDTIASLQWIGRMKREEGAINEAVMIESEALALARAHLKNEPWLIAEVLVQYGLSLRAAGRLHDAKEALLESYALTEKSFGRRNVEAIAAATGLAELFADAHRQEPEAGHDAEAARWSELARHEHPVENAKSE